MEKVHEFTLDIGKGANTTNITTVTGDYASHKFLITLVEDGYKPVNLEDTVVRLVVRKSDGTTVQQDCTIVDTEGIVSVLLKLDTINVAGTCKAEIQIWDNEVANKRLTSAQFYFRVRKSLQDDETVISTDTFSMLQQALQDIQDLELDEQRIHEIEQAIEQLQEDIENISVGDDPQLAHKIGNLEELVEEIRTNLESKDLQLNLVNAINELHTLLNDRLGTSEQNLTSHLAENASDTIRPHGMGAIASQDYEEGTWTPRIHNTGTEYILQEGDYVRVGKIVHITGRVQLSKKPTSHSTDTVAMIGFPFPRSSKTVNNSMFMLKCANMVEPISDGVGFFADTVYLTLSKLGNNIINRYGETIKVRDLTDTSEITISGWYYIV